MDVIYKDTNENEQTIKVFGDSTIEVISSACEAVPVHVDLPQCADRAPAGLGLVHAILVASGLHHDYEIALKADAESGSAEELAAGRALVAEREAARA